MNVKNTASGLLACAAFLPLALFAQAPVVDLTAQQRSAEVAQQSAARNNYLEIQTLRQEVTALRGIVEELSYTLRKIQQRQDEDYQDLDRRLSGAAPVSQNNEEGVGYTSRSPSGNGSNTPPNSANTPVLPSYTTGSVPAVDPNSPVLATPSAVEAAQNAVARAESDAAAEELYRTGFAALRTGNRTLAVRNFESLVERHSGASREADALYWLGETYWLDLDAEKSRQSFVKLLNDYPNYRKVDEAKYRLGLIYGQLGDKAKAIEYMKELAASNSGQAEQAKAYLRDAGAL